MMEGRSLLPDGDDDGEGARRARLRLVCHRNNGRALAFYRKLDFLPYDLKSQASPDGDRFTAIHLVRELV